MVFYTIKQGLNALLAICAEFCREMRMKLSAPKTYILTNARYSVSWELEDASLEEVLVAKYLGVSISMRGRNMVGVTQQVANY